jgi:leader peptidase (prepilin peptidase)/N-methyltransferase
MLEVFPPIFLFLLGLSVGSFMNVLILRFGFSERAMARSHCAQCGASIAWYDLVPVVSFFLLRGRCRSCGSRLSLQYPIVEMLTGLLFVLSYETFPPELALLSFVSLFSLLLFWSASLATATYDIRHTLVPLPFVAAIAIAAAVSRGAEALAFADYFPFIDATAGALALGGFFALVVFVTGGKGMGMGDAYAASAIGIMLGIAHGIEAVVLGVWSATVFYLALFLFSSFRLSGTGARVTMKTELPFAPWLFFGAALSMFTGLSPLRTVESVMTALWMQ